MDEKDSLYWLVRVIGTLSWSVGCGVLGNDIIHNQKANYQRNITSFFNHKYEANTVITVDLFVFFLAFFLLFVYPLWLLDLN